MEEPFLSNITSNEYSRDTFQSLNISIPIFSLVVITWRFLCAVFRYQRLRSTRTAYPYPNRRSYASMTQSDAFYIQQNLVELEFPLMFQKALQFALFRTYGIPSISNLLVQTGQLSQRKTSSKRYADTVVLIAEFMGYHPESKRATEAIGRMNFLHGQYIKLGKISNDDMLYTLSLFVLEPIRWVQRYEWREFEDFEKCATGVFWKGMGDAMNISFDALKSGGEGGRRWQDGLQWVEEIDEWAEAYEKRNMVPDVKNFETAEETTELLLWSVPQWAKHYGRTVVTALMDDRLRKAMMYPPPPTAYVRFVNLVFHIRKYIIRYLCLPRPSMFRFHLTTYSPSEDGTFFLTSADAAPWYIRPSLWNRYGPTAWMSRSMGLPLPGDEGEKFWPQGYRVSEIGPGMMSGAGMKVMEQDQEKIAKLRSVTCPFGRMKL